MAALIDLLWTFTQTQEMDKWDSAVVDLLPADECDNAAHADRYCYSHLDARDQQFLTELLNAVVEIGRANLYAGFVSSLTRDQAYAVALMLHSRGYPVSAIERFQCSRVEECHGWGDPTKRKAFNEGPARREQDIET